MGNAIPDIRRGNIHISRDHRVSALGGKPTPSQHHKAHQTPQHIYFLPSSQIRHIVLTDEIKKPRTWKSRHHGSHGIHRERWPRPFCFASITKKIWLILDGRLDHLTAHSSGHRWTIELVRRDICRDENDPLEAEFLHRIPRHNEMSMVDRIEAPAK